MFDTIEAAAEALSRNGWTEIKPWQVGTYKARGGSLVVITSTEPAAAGWAVTLVNAVLLSPEEEARAVAEGAPAPADGVAALRLVGAYTSRRIWREELALSADGLVRVWWSPFAQEAQQREAGADAVAAGGVAPGAGLLGAAGTVAAEVHARALADRVKVYQAAGLSRAEAMDVVLVTLRAEYAASLVDVVLSAVVEEEDE